MDGNGSTQTTRPSYDQWARGSLQELGEDATAVPPGTWVWAFARIGSAIVYALLEIARAIREHQA